MLVLEKFDEFVHQLDGGQGDEIVYPHLTRYTYLTNITAAQANEIRKKEFVRLLLPRQLENDAKSFLSAPIDLDLPSYNSSREPALEPRANWESPSLADQLRFLSYKGEGRPPLNALYKRDDSGGEGTRIFMMDTGFNLEVSELKKRRKRPTTYLVPAHLHDQVYNGFPILPHTIDDRWDHGTSMAVLAGGATMVVAPNADLELIKVYADYDAPNPANSLAISMAAYAHMLDYIENRIREIQGQNQQEKLLVFFAASVRQAPHPEVNKQSTTLWTDFVSFLQASNVLFVISAGNDAHTGVTLADRHIVSLGKPDNIVVTVGGVLLDGTLFRSTVPENPHVPNGGSISIFAPAIGDTMNRDGKVIVGGLLGTSGAASITVGLLAYFMGINPCDAEIEYNAVDEFYDASGAVLAVKLKHYAQGWAFPRSNQDPPDGYPELNAVYNGAYGGRGF